MTFKQFSLNIKNLKKSSILLISRSTSEKISYHFIHANPAVLFENNITLGLIIKVIIHYLLWLIASHKCSSFNINFTSEKCTITDLIILLTPYVNILRLHCTACHILSNSITATEIVTY